jgi:hypothetical protein
VRFNENPCVREFGLTVGAEFEEVDARVLNAPQLEYKVSKLIETSYSGSLCNMVHISGPYYI